MNQLNVFSYEINITENIRNQTKHYFKRLFLLLCTVDKLYYHTVVDYIFRLLENYQVFDDFSLDLL